MVGGESKGQGSTDNYENVSSERNELKDLPGGPVAETPCSQCRGPRVRSLVRELDPTGSS